MKGCIHDLKASETRLVRCPTRLLDKRPYTLAEGGVVERLLLADLSGELWVVKDPRYCLGPELQVEQTLQTLILSTRQGPTPSYTLKEASSIDPNRVGPRLIPARLAPRPQDLVLLTLQIHAVASRPLQQVLRGVFSDPAIYTPYVRVPASQANHHAYPGGLLRHSLEVAQTALQLTSNALERDLAVTAGLLHDIGKIRTFSATQTRTRLGYVVDHEELTFEVLSPWINELKNQWRDGYIALHQLLGSERTYADYPESSLRQLLRMADRRSAQFDLERQAFANLPGWRNHARAKGGVPVWRARGEGPQEYKRLKGLGSSD